MYDLLIVGAGITAATLVATLKDRLRICVVDCRSHLGGNCYDENAEGTRIHRYGPHIFHCSNLRIKRFLDAFTEWVPYTHRVLAEVRDGNHLRQVPFPYCRATTQALGRDLADSEVIDMFFRNYSQKMWGMPWEHLPVSVRNRVPKKLMDHADYYRDSFVALPRLGYTRMMENMLDGAELILGAPPDEWTKISAQRVIYTGRPDLVPMPGESHSIARRAGLELNYRMLDIEFSREEWRSDAVSINACSAERAWTRKTCFARMTGGTSQVVSTETPRAAEADELTPYYPIEIPYNQQRYRSLVDRIRTHYPSLELAGRLGSYRYFDMHHAVGQAIALAERLWRVSVRALSA